MYYLIIENLGVDRCIHKSETDIYKDGMSFSCTPDLGFAGGVLVNEITIVCLEVPGSSLKAKVYR